MIESCAQTFGQNISGDRSTPSEVGFLMNGSLEKRRHSHWSGSLTVFLYVAGWLNFAVPSIAQEAPTGFERFDPAPIAPKTIFYDEANNAISIEKFAGKIVILNLWATWCAPCVKEMPSLDRLTERLPSDRFEVVAVSQDKGGLAVSKPYLERLGIRALRVYADPSGRLYREYGARGMPTSLIVGARGELLGRIEGAIEWDGDKVVSFLANLTHARR